MRRFRAGLAALLLVAAAGCGGSGDDEPTDGSPGTPVGSARTLSERCGSGIPSGAEVEAVRLPGEEGTTLSAAAFDGGGDTVLVLLHQTGPWGLCGWGRFATQAADRGLSSLAVDLCGYGDSVCAEGLESRPEVLVDLAASYARETMGARRVVLVGASMGGSETVIAVAGGARVDAWADLSGPSTWDGVRLLGLADRLRKTRLPGLVAHAADDDRLQYAAARRLARASGARFLDGASGHGYELLTDALGLLLPDGRTLVDFALDPA